MHKAWVQIPEKEENIFCIIYNQSFLTDADDLCSKQLP